jgi:hypothetical protein
MSWRHHIAFGAAVLLTGFQLRPVDLNFLSPWHPGHRNEFP